jgi:hypothetical protein
MTDQPLDLLASTEQLLTLLDEAPRGDYFSVDLVRRSIERQRDDLLIRRFGQVAVADEVIDLDLRPARVAESGAEVGLLSTVLAELQGAVTAIAQSLRERPTTRGPITAGIQEAARLNVAFALPGSLRLRLVPAEPVLQQLLRANEGESLLDDSLDELVGLLDAAGADDREDLLQRLASIGPRAAGHVASLSAALDRGETALGLGWRSPHQQRTVFFKREHAQFLASLLRTMESTERTLVVRGRLVGGSLVRRTFELELEDGSLLSGPADEDAVDTLEELFGQDCTAHLLVTEARLASGETKEAHRLQRLEP